MPCHSSTGGERSKSKVNFTEWTHYTAEKQKALAEKSYSELSKGGMPPAFVRENRPEIIPTKEQSDILKLWSESFKPAKK